MSEKAPSRASPKRGLQDERGHTRMTPGSGRRTARAAHGGGEPRRPWWTRLKDYAFVGELILIAFWAMFLGSAYLNFNPSVIPSGSEFGIDSQTAHLWTQFLKCGWCAVWNGSEQGGIPAFVDLHGGVLHPFVMIPTLLFGVVNGAKLTILLSLWLAGAAQWLIAKELGLGPVPRLFTAGIAVAGGHLAVNMDPGQYEYILAIASSALLVAGLLHLWKHGGRRSAVLLGVLGAGFALSGTGYLQIGMVEVLPAALLIFLDNPGRRELWKELLLALVAALLLTAPLLIPLAHFAPNLAKEIDPGTFNSAQPLQYIPLNLIISDRSFYGTPDLGKLPWPSLYGLYIGWIPVILAAIGLSRAPKAHRWVCWFLAGGALLAFIAASAIFARALAKNWPATIGWFFVGGLRFAPVIAELAVPLILALSAVGLQQVWNASSNWPRLSLNLPTSGTSPRWQLPLQWLLIIPLVYSLESVYGFSRQWYQVQAQPPAVAQVVAALKTDSMQWVSPPPGIFAFIEPAVAAGLKISPGFMNERWRGRELPQPVLVASFTGSPQGALEPVNSVQGNVIYRMNSNPYAAVVSDPTSQACNASGSGGQITIVCDAVQSGRLVVEENAWTGWNAWVDGKPAALLPGNWLTVDAPAGQHTFEFRYLPWDVPIGLGLCALGILLCLWLWWRPLPFRVTQGEEHRAE